MQERSKMSKPPFKWGSSEKGEPILSGKFLLDSCTRREILHSFGCPRDCRDFEEAFASIIGCPFGHYDLAHKKVLPSFICVPYLLDECSKKISSDELLFCEDGFHLADKDLLDLDQFTKKMADCILHRGSLQTKSEYELSGTTVFECCICFAPFNGIYGQLSDCTHVFCTKCITDWFKKERNCPVCRKSSRFIIAWHRLITSKEEKAKIARMQAEMVKVSDLNDSAMFQPVLVPTLTNQTNFGFNWGAVDFDWGRFIDLPEEHIEPLVPVSHLAPQRDVYAPLAYLDAISHAANRVGIEPVNPLSQSQVTINREVTVAGMLEPRTITTTPQEQIQAQVNTNSRSYGWRGSYSFGRSGIGSNRGGTTNGRGNFRGNDRGYRGGGDGNRGNFHYNNFY